MKFQALEGLKFQDLKGLKFQNKQTQKQMTQTMETDTEELSGSDSHECKLREFKLKARYLLFCISAKELPTKGNLSKLIKDAMEEAGSVENIKLYCFLTPQQLGTLGSKSHLCLFNIFIKIMFFLFHVLDKLFFLYLQQQAI